MARILDMPRLADTMEQGVLRKWRKNEGEEVAPGEVLAEVETDKATMDFESFDEGVLLKRLIEDGATVPVGSPIAIIGKQGDDIAKLVEEARARASGATGKPAPAPSRATSASARRRHAPRPAPAAIRPAPALGTTSEDGPAVAPPAPAPGPGPAHLVPERRAATRPAPASPSDDLVKPLSMMRRTIARRMVESKTTVPHFYLTAEVDMDPAMEFRHQVGQLNNTTLTVNHLVIKASALGLRRVPEANASFTEEAIIQHARVDISMAVAIEDGLVTPVIRDADKKTLGQIANEARELAARARERKLRVEEITGGTFSVSNLGMYGIQQFDAIINPPEGAILSVGTVRKVPVVKGDAVVPGRRMTMTLSCDHRVIDGALGAKLLQAIVSILERPISLAF